MNIEEAYRAIAEVAIAEAGTLNWEYLTVDVEIFEKMGLRISLGQEI